jgi:hypothetical protein
MHRVTAITPTICRLMDIAPPANACDPPIVEVIDAANAAGIARIDRCLVYAPDAIGRDLVESHPAAFDLVQRYAPLAIDLRSMYPPKTPVNFASMFTGAPPEVHGIRKYERPVLTCDTIFDALIRAGRHPAIVAVKNSSIDLIFRNRSMDYFCEPYDGEVTERAIERIASGVCDSLLVYHQEYDDALHRTTPRSPEAIRAMRNHIESFVRLASAAADHWRNVDHAVFFSPDHGAHVDSATGRGAHGDDISEDMVVRHFVGINAEIRKRPPIA